MVSVLLWPCAIGTSDSADNNAVADAAKIVIPLFFIGISLRSRSFFVRIFLAELFPFPRGLLGVLENLLRHHAERRPQGSGVAVTGFVDRELVRVLAPEEVARPPRRLVRRIQIETDFFGQMNRNFKRPFL